MFSIRTIFRFLVPMLVVLALLAAGAVRLVDQLAFAWFRNDLDIRSKLIASTLHDPLISLIQAHDETSMRVFFTRVLSDERLYALVLCSPEHQTLYRSNTFPQSLDCQSTELWNDSTGFIERLESGPLHLAVHTLNEEGRDLGRLVLAHDMSFADRRISVARRSIFAFFVLLGLAISLITVLVAEMSLRGWMNGVRALVRGDLLRSPKGIFAKFTPSPELRPLVQDLRALIRDLEKDSRRRDESQMSWTAKTLKDILNRELSGDEILIVSNREPYIHQRKGNEIQVQFPASGLVTALEPVMRACSGTWIAHGSGTADREVVDKNDHVQVPPNEPTYQIRRIWLSEQEERGYYYGFSNEGLWPLCHMAHTRPIFRPEDWNQYVRVNQRFAKAVVEESKTKNPVILVQDYHFALLPKMIRDQLPEATIITFWHIPWPNPESFGICPWREQILEGLLGSSILGFHTRFHCHNFVDAVDRYLEARIDRETLNVTAGGQETAVRHYPISIEWPSRAETKARSIAQCRRELREENNLPPHIALGIGVDRLDYTKGLVERFLAVERLLEKHPEWVGRFSFIQIAAPSRTSIEQYQNFETEVRQVADRVNQRFGREGYLPILLKIEHHSPVQVFEYFRAADVCMVTSLHDGMNLVAKEFISARNDERGVLILSQFAGASRELPEALIVNPYDVEQCARELATALSMPALEQTDRMRSMRSLVREFNVYRWAGRMLIDAARLRQKNRILMRWSDGDWPETGTSS